MRTTTVQRKTTGRVRRQSYRNHPEVWQHGPFKGHTKCNEERDGDRCQLATDHRARHFGRTGKRWNHSRVGAH